MTCWEAWSSCLPCRACASRAVSSQTACSWPCWPPARTCHACRCAASARHRYLCLSRQLGDPDTCTTPESWQSKQVQARQSRSGVGQSCLCILKATAPCGRVARLDAAPVRAALVCGISRCRRVWARPQPQPPAQAVQAIRWALTAVRTMGAATMLAPPISCIVRCCCQR